MSRRRLQWLWLLLLVPVLLPGLALWLTGSEGGARWLWGRAASSWPGTLQATQITGDLGRGLVMHELRLLGEGFELTAAEVRLQAKPGLRPPGVSVQSLQALDVVLELAPTANPDAAPERSVRDVLESLQLPFTLDLRNVVLRQVVVRKSGETRFTGAEVRFNGRWGETLDAALLEVEGDQWTGSVRGRVEFHEPFRHDLEGTWQALVPGWVPRELAFSLSGDASDTLFAARGVGPGLEASAMVRDLLGDATFTGEVSVPRWPLENLAADAGISGLSATVEGTPSAWAIQARGLLDFPGVAAGDLELEGRGDTGAMRIERLALSSQPVQLTAQGRLAWSPEPSLELGIELQRGSPDHWLAGWPPAHPVQGSARLEWRVGHVRLAEAELRIPGTPAQVLAAGTWDLAADLARAELTWHELAWPVGARPAVHRSKHGELRLSGSPDSWTLQGQFDLASEGVAAGQVKLAGDGTRQGVIVHTLEGQLLGGTIGGAMQLDWRPSPGASADLDLQGIGIGSLWPGWPAQLDARLGVVHRTQPWQTSVVVRELLVRLHGRELSGQGEVTLSDSGARFSAFELAEPGSTAYVDGDLEGREGLEFRLHLQRPGIMADWLGTSVSGQGRLALGNGQPVLEGRIDGGPGQWQSLAVESFSVQAHADSASSGLRVDADFAQVRLGEQQLPAIALRIEGPAERLGISLAMELPPVWPMDRAHLEAIGGLTGWRIPAQWQWQGTLESLRLEHAGEPQLTLERPSPLALAAAGVKFDQACLAAPMGGRLCASGDWRRDAGLSLAGRLQDWPLGRFMAPLMPGIEFTQVLDGTVDWRHSPGQAPGGHAALSLSAGSFGPADDAESRVATGPGYFGFDMDSGQLGAGRLQLEFVDKGTMDVDWGVEDVALDGSGRLSGRAQIQSLDLSVLDSLWPQLERISGEFDADLGLGGSVGDPRFEGDFALRGAALSWSVLGARVTGLDLQGTVNVADQMEFRGPFLMGEGSGVVEGSMDFSAPREPAWQVRIRGDQLRVADLPALQVDANPALQLAWQDGVYRLSGNLHIPGARLAPSGAIFSRVTESEDVRIVAGATAADFEPEPMRQANLEGSLEVTLGEEVRLRMDTVDAMLTGGVVLDWPHTLVPNAQGQVLVNGEVRAFGPLLHITNGRVRFTGGPVDDPELSLRAVRDIFGNTQIQTAGVMVTGTAQRPEIEAYTNPLTTEDRAWALLITGQDFEYGQGVGAFDIGTYIAPRLYISYGVSLFDEANMVSARYDLRRGFGIKATSSQTENGLDISYTLNRGRKGETEQEE